MSNILLIEDNEAIIMGLEYLFTNNGYNVRVARSAYQAKVQFPHNHTQLQYLPL